MSNESEADRAARHVREIEEIIDQGSADALNKSGAELIEVRQRTSRLIREACSRHVREANVVVPAAPQPEGPDASELTPPDEPGAPAVAPAADEIEQPLPATEHGRMPTAG